MYAIRSYYGGQFQDPVRSGGHSGLRCGRGEPGRQPGGGLKKVLSNVKTRGILGEFQLGGILEQVLAPEQYAKNVVTKKGSRDNVEFAIILPGKDDSGGVVYLPLDSKFPVEDYHSLLEAYEHADHAAIEEAIKLLDNTIKKCAKDIRDKYIDPPATTDFGIMFLPFEGLYRNNFV